MSKMEKVSTQRKRRNREASLARHKQVVAPQGPYPIECRQCGTTFYTKPAYSARQYTCSRVCQHAFEQDYRTLVEYARGTPKSMADLVTMSKLVKFSPAQASKLRSQIADMVGDHIELADAVVRGDKTWTPTQARVFSTLLNKCLPDLSASYHQHEHSHKALREMSREELERIAMGIEEHDTIPDGPTNRPQIEDAQYTEVQLDDSSTPTPAQSQSTTQEPDDEGPQSAG